MRLALMLALIATPAVAYENANKTALALGTILGSEVACGFALDVQAVEAFVGERVDPAEMNFASSLDLMAQGTAGQIKAMTEAAKAAHCKSVAASAEHYRLMKSP